MFDKTIWSRLGGGSVAAADDTDWRRNPSSFARFTTKITGLIKHSFTSRPLPDWEKEIASRPGMILHPRVSKLAQSAAGNFPHQTAVDSPF